MTNNKKRILKKIEPRKLCFEFFDILTGAPTPSASYSNYEIDIAKMTTREIWVWLSDLDGKPKFWKGTVRHGRLG